MNRAVGAITHQRQTQILQHAYDEFDPDVFLLCETNGFRVRQALGPRTWRTHQGWALGRDNNTIAWKRDLTATQQRFWIGTWPNGHTLEPRWINRVRLGIGHTVVHIPPERDQALVPGYLARMSKHSYAQPLAWAGDRNGADMRTWAEQHGYHYREQGVMFLASSLPILRYRVTEFLGLDHQVLVADLGQA